MERDERIIKRNTELAVELLEQGRSLALKDGAIIYSQTPRFHDPVNKAVDVLDEALKRLEEAKYYGAFDDEIAEIKKEILDVRDVLVGNMDA